MPTSSLIDNLIDKMDIIAIGGGWPTPFKSAGIEGRSLAEDDPDEARRLLIKAELGPL